MAIEDRYHPEKRSDEIFLTNSTMGDVHSIGWKTKRVGNYAYDIKGCEVRGLFPVFVSRKELECDGFFIQPVKENTIMKLITNFSHKDALLYKKAVEIYETIDPNIKFEVRFEAYGMGGFKVTDCLALWANKNVILELIDILNFVRKIESKKD